MAESNGGTTQTTRVSLGCGTLILIALIVMMFSDREVDQKDIDELRDQLARVEAKVDSLNARLGTAAP